jgi:PAS domain S-box-containing protein
MNTKVNYDGLLENLHECLFIMNPDLKIQAWNNAMTKFSGILKEIALNQDIFDILPSLYEECDYYFREAVLKEARIIDLQHCTLIKPKSGKVVTVNARFVPMRDEENNILGIMVTLKENAYVLQNSYFEMLEAVSINTNDAILITQSEPIGFPAGPKIIYCNPAFTRMTGYSPEDVLGKTPRLLQGEKSSKKELARLRKALESWESYRGQLLNYTKSGEEFWVELDIVPVKNEEGYYTHWVAIQRDITDRRQILEKLNDLNNDLDNKVAERTKELENFSYFLAHDLKQPARIVASFVKLLEKENINLEGRAKEYLKYINQGANSIMQMVDALLKITVLNKTDLKISQIHFEEIILQALDNLQEEIIKGKAKVVFGELPKVSIDKELMLNLSQNLIENAIKYSDKEVPEIKIYATEEDGFVNIHFQDNGIGFHNGEIKEAFQLFRRNTKNKEIKGQGIGLTICKKIVEKHKGEVTIISEPNVGSTVTVRLPMEKEPQLSLSN